MSLKFGGGEGKYRKVLGYQMFHIHQIMEKGFVFDQMWEY
jgi:hypothetical protein